MAILYSRLDWFKFEYIDLPYFKNNDNSLKMWKKYFNSSTCIQEKYSILYMIGKIRPILETGDAFSKVKIEHIDNLKTIKDKILQVYIDHINTLKNENCVRKISFFQREMDFIKFVFGSNEYQLKIIKEQKEALEKKYLNSPYIKVDISQKTENIFIEDILNYELKKTDHNQYDMKLVLHGNLIKKFTISKIKYEELFEKIIEYEKSNGNISLKNELDIKEDMANKLSQLSPDINTVLTFKI